MLARRGQSRPPSATGQSGSVPSQCIATLIVPDDLGAVEDYIAHDIGWHSKHQQDHRDQSGNDMPLLHLMDPTSRITRPAVNVTERSEQSGLFRLAFIR